MPNEFTYDEYLKQKPSLDKRNYKTVVCDVSGGIVPNNKTVDKLSTDNQQATGKNLHLGDNKVTGQKNSHSANKQASLLPKKAKSDCKELNCKKSVSLSSLEKAKISSVHRNLNVAKRPKCETSKSLPSASLPLIEAPMYIQFETKKGRYPSNNSTHSNGPKSCEAIQLLTTSKSIRSSNPAMIAKNYKSPFYKRQPIKPPIHSTKYCHQLWDRSTNPPRIPRMQDQHFKQDQEPPVSSQCNNSPWFRYHIQRESSDWIKFLNLVRQITSQ